MDSKKAYEKYKGREVLNNNNDTITICGYDRDGWLIGAFKAEHNGWPYSQLSERNTILTHQNNPRGYWYVSIDTVVKQLTVKLPLKARLIQWIKKVF